LLVMQPTAPISRAAYAKAFGEAGLEVRLLQEKHSPGMDPGCKDSLYEVQGYHGADAPALKQLTKLLGPRLKRASIIGWYANPQEEKTDESTPHG